MEREDPRTKVTARCPEALKEQYQSVLDERGLSMSDDLREHMEQVVQQHGGAPETGEMPADEQLTNAYRALWRNADPDTHRIDGEVAETIASEAAKVRAKVVKDSILKPLEDRGYLTPQWGTIVVYPPDVVPVLEES
jgi:antitoxin component of RelBE/YafQ-DinJ toxin-antitoxin module